MGHRLSLSEEFVSCVWFAPGGYRETVRLRQGSWTEASISMLQIDHETGLVGHSGDGRLGRWKAHVVVAQRVGASM